MEDESNLSGISLVKFNTTFLKQKLSKEVSKQDPELNKTTIIKAKTAITNYQNNISDQNPLKNYQVQSDAQQYSSSCNFNCFMKIYRKQNLFKIIRFMFSSIFIAICIHQTINPSQNLGKLLFIEVPCQIYFSFDIILKALNPETSNKCIILLEILMNFIAYVSFGYQFNVVSRYLKAARTWKILLFINDWSVLRIPAEKMINSIKSAGKILLPALAFIFLYAVSGLYYFSDLEYNKCRQPSNKNLSENWTVYETYFFLCGQKMCPIIGGTQLECLNPIDFGVQPNPNQLINIIQGNGLLHYQNFIYAFISTLKQIFITGSSRLIVLHKQAMNSTFVIIYYMSFLYLISYIYLNIFYGMMMLTEQKQNLPADNVSKNQSNSNFKNFISQTIQRSMKSIRNISQNTHPVSYNNNINTDQKNKQRKRSDKFQSISNQIVPKQKQNQEHQENKEFQNQIDVIWNETNSLESQQISHIQLPDNKKSYVIIQKAQSNHLNIEQFSDCSIANTVRNKLQMGEKQQCSQQKFNDQVKSQKSQQLKQQYLQQSFQLIQKKLSFIKHIIVFLTILNLMNFLNTIFDDFFIVVGILDLIVLISFTFEMIAMIFFVKLYKQKFTDNNLIQVVILIVAWITTFVSLGITGNLIDFLEEKESVKFFSSFIKYLRIFIILGESIYFQEVKAIFNFTIRSVKNIKNFIFLWSYIVLTFSLVACYLFYNKTKISQTTGQLDLVNGQSFEINLDTIQNSLIFTSLTFYNEQWDVFMFQQYLGGGFLLVIWQYFSIMFGLIIVSKYFMALLIDQIGKKLDESPDFSFAEKQEQQEVQSQEKIIKPDEANQKDQLKQKMKNSIQLISSQSQSNSSINSFTNSSQKSGSNNFDQQKINNIVCQFQSRMDIQTVHKMFTQRTRRLRRFSAVAQQINGKNIQQFQKLQNQKRNSQTQNDSDFSIHKLQNYLRLYFCSKNSYYVRILFCLIGCSSQILYDRYIPAQDNIVCIVLFKIQFSYFMAQALVGLWVFDITGQFSYFRRSLMNIINFIVTIISILNFIPGDYQNYWISLLVTFKCLRVANLLDFQYRYDGNMRLTLVSFVKLLPKVLSLLVIMGIFFCFFGMCLTKVYGQSFNRCLNHVEDSSIISQTDCYQWGGDWVAYKINASNLFESIVYLFLIATTEGWSVLMSKAAALSGENLQPISGSNQIMYYAFSFFFFFGNMIILNVFIGISIYNFKKIKQEVTGESRLNKNQRQWFSIKSQIYRLAPIPLPTPKQNFILGFCFLVLNCKIYKSLKIILSLVFFFTLCLIRSNQDQTQIKYIQICIYSFVAFNFIDYCLCWLAYGIKISYWGKLRFIFQSMSAFYLFICIFIELFYEAQLSKEDHKLVYGLLVNLNLCKAFAVLSQIPFMSRLFSSLLSVLPATVNLFFIITVVLYIYTVIGVYLFGYLKPNEELNQFDQNYHQFFSALYALMKFSTMQSPIMQISDGSSTMSPHFVCFDVFHYEDYLQYGQNGCGDKAIAYIYFLTFHILYSLILFSTLMAITFDAYSQVYKEEQALVNKFQLEQVRNQWAKYDTQATGYLRYRDFWLFTAKLIKIYSFQKNGIMSNSSKQQFLQDLNIPIYEDSEGVLSFQFHQVIEGLTRVYLLEKKGSNFNSQKTDELFEELNLKHSTSKVKQSGYNSSQVLSLIILKAGLKVWRRKVNVENQQRLQDKIKSFGQGLIGKTLQPVLNLNLGNDSNQNQKEEKIMTLVNLLGGPSNSKSNEQTDTKQQNRKDKMCQQSVKQLRFNVEQISEQEQYPNKQEIKQNQSKFNQIIHQNRKNNKIKSIKSLNSQKSLKIEQSRQKTINRELSQKSRLQVNFQKDSSYDNEIQSIGYQQPVKQKKQFQNIFQQYSEEQQ